MSRQAPGFTLIELLCCLALLAGVLGWGTPSFREISLNTARTREVTRFVQAVYLARSEAIKRNGVVSLCPSRNGATCGPAGTAWHEGWTVFVNDDRDSPANRDDGETLLRVHAAWHSGPGRCESDDIVIPRVWPDRGHGDADVLRQARFGRGAGRHHQPVRPAAHFAPATRPEAR